MKKQLVKLLSMLLVFTFIFSFAACGDNTKETTTEAANTEADTPVNANTTEAVTGSINDPSQVSSDAVSNDATVTDNNSETGTATATQPVNSTKPEGIDAIVAYFNASANKVKVDKPGYKLSVTNIIGKITVDKLSWIITKAVDYFKDDIAAPKVSEVAKGASHSEFPVKGQTWSSKLEPSAVQSAKCDDKGSYYEIEIKLKNEKLSAPPSNPPSTAHGKVMNVLDNDEIDEQIDKIKIVSMEKFAPNFTGSYVKCTIDKVTGNIKSVTYYFAIEADIIAKVTGVRFTGFVPFAIQQKYDLKY